MIGHSMVGMAGPSLGAVNLSGTTGAPNSSDDFDLDPGTATAGWYFRSDASVDYYILGLLLEFSPDPDEWFDPNGTPPATYYIKATQYSGDAPTAGDSLGIVYALTSDRSWRWVQSVIGSKAGILKIEIFSDSGGTDLLATGYYSGSVEIFDGA